MSVEADLDSAALEKENLQMRNRKEDWEEKSHITGKRTTGGDQTRAQKTGYVLRKEEI